MRARTYTNLAALPSGYERLFEEAAGESFYYSRPWFQNLVDTTSLPQDQLRLYGIENDRANKEPLALLIARSAGRRSGFTSQRTLSSFSNMYSVLFGPILASRSSDTPILVGHLVHAIATEQPHWDIVHLDSLEYDSPVFTSFIKAFRTAGFWTQPYFHFGNWYEDTSECSIQKYLERRPTALRNTLRRKHKKLSAQGRVRYELVVDAEGIEPAIADYEKVYAGSWKKREPFPHFTKGLIRSAASTGALRLGVLYVDGEPAAAQIWIVAGARGTIYKLAYDEQFKALSVGSLLTIRIMEHVIEIDKVNEVDFGRGDDPYKSQWLSRRRERWGIMAFNPRAIKGALAAARHIGGHAAKSALVRLAGKLVGRQ
jgi:hypothetical protein